MAEYTGQNLVISWLSAGGTTALSGDYRSVTLTPNVTMIDTTAGSDASRTYITSFKDLTVSVSLVAQTGGTALENALKAGTSGTLIVGPEGTASGKRKYSIVAFSLGARYSYPYDNLVEITCDFQPTGNDFDTMYGTY